VIKSISLFGLVCILSASTLSVAQELILLREDKDEASYYEPNTIRKTGQFTLVWVVTLRRGEKHSEYLTEFDCNRAMYRQVALRVFNAERQVISSDAIYRQWLDVPNTSQEVLGLVFKKACPELQRPTPSIER
jgi:hypothetical protein